MPKKSISQSEGFVISWNKKRKNAKNITLFVRYKGWSNPEPVEIWDIASYLMRTIREIEKERKNEPICKGCGEPILEGQAVVKGEDRHSVCS